MSLLVFILIWTFCQKIETVWRSGSLIICNRVSCTKLRTTEFWIVHKLSSGIFWLSKKCWICISISTSSFFTCWKLDYKLYLCRITKGFLGYVSGRICVGMVSRQRRKTAWTVSCFKDYSWTENCEFDYFHISSLIKEIFSLNFLVLELSFQVAEQNSFNISPP